MTSWNRSTGWDGAPEEYFQNDLDRLEESLYTGSTNPQDLTDRELNDLLNDPVTSPVDSKLRQEKDRRQLIHDDYYAESKTTTTTTSTQKTQDSISKKEFRNEIYGPIQEVSKRFLGGSLDKAELNKMIDRLYKKYSTTSQMKLIEDLHSNDKDRQEDALIKVGERLGYI